MLIENQGTICHTDYVTGLMMIIEWTTTVKNFRNNVLMKKFNFAFFCTKPSINICSLTVGVQMTQWTIKSEVVHL